MSFSIKHTQISSAAPFWYHLEYAKDLESATRRARNYTLDHGGYVCVKNHDGKVVYGTDPIELDRAISKKINRHFTNVSNQLHG